MEDYGGIEHAGAAFELARELELQRARASRRGGARWVRAGATLSLLALSAVVAFRRLATPLSEASAARQNNLGAAAADASLLAPLSFSARSDGYEPLADHTIEMYSRFSHIVEPHKRTYLAADGASTSDHSGFAWHVARLAHGGAVATPDEELMAERESGASVWSSLSSLRLLFSASLAPPAAPARAAAITSHVAASGYRAYRRLNRSASEPVRVTSYSSCAFSRVSEGASRKSRDVR